MSSAETHLGAFYPSRGESVDPSRYLDERFELFSIPAYDRGLADQVTGSEIGSGKKLLQPNDVILSRIVPHIRRCWIVPENGKYRQIGSGEWIIFRSKSIVPGYLRYYLLSDLFNSKFMSTVKGVGGSLLRADPRQVAKFKIPLPPLEEQKQIAAILDAADELRQKDKALIAKYDELTQSLFLDMFGDESGDEYLLNDIADRSQKGTFSNGPFGSDLLTSELTSEGIPVVYIRDIRNGTFEWKSNVFVTQQKAAYLKNCQVMPGDVLIAKVGDPPGVAATYPRNKEMAVITQDVIRLRVNPQIATSTFIHYWLNSHIGQRKLDPIIVEGTRKRFGLGDMKKLTIAIPQINLQNQFVDRVQSIESQKVITQESLLKTEDLFNNLLQKAFKGELTN